MGEEYCLECDQPLLDFEVLYCEECEALLFPDGEEDDDEEEDEDLDD